MDKERIKTGFRDLDSEAGNTAEIIVLKHKAGKPGTVYLTWDYQQRKSLISLLTGAIVFAPTATVETLRFITGMKFFANKKLPPKRQF